MVISKEKEYVEIIEPSELELKELLEVEKQKQILEARKELLPMKLQQLSVLKIKMPTEDEIISLDDTQWTEFYKLKFQEHNDTLAEEERKAKEEVERIEREAKIKADAEARAEIEKEELIKKAEEDKIKAVEQVKKDAELQALREKQEIEDKAKREQLEKEAKEKADKEAQAKMEAGKKYQKFLKDNEYDETTDILKNENGQVKLYRLINTFNQ